jgi:hypothetical protein
MKVSGGGTLTTHQFSPDALKRKGVEADGAERLGSSHTKSHLRAALEILSTYLQVAFVATCNRGPQRWRSRRVLAARSRIEWTRKAPPPSIASEWSITLSPAVSRLYLPLFSLRNKAVSSFENLCRKMQGVRVCRVLELCRVYGWQQFS